MTASSSITRSAMCAAFSTGSRTSSRASQRQPVFGGPVYVFRNALYNVVAEPFKMHNSPSRRAFLSQHDREGRHAILYLQHEPVRHAMTRNNLFIGTGGAIAFESTAKMHDCDFDFDGVGGGAWEAIPEMEWRALPYGRRNAREGAGVEARSCRRSGGAVRERRAGRQPTSMQHSNPPIFD